MKNIPKIKDLRALCQPSDLDICLYRKLFTRKISIYFTAVFLHLRFSANSVSILKGIIACLGSVLFALGRPLWYLIGALFLQLSFILDACDGEVARYTGTNVSAGGEFLDKLGDAGSRGLFYGAWGWGMYNMTGSVYAIAAGTIMAALALVVRFCAVETLLESYWNHFGKPAGEGELRALDSLFVRNANGSKIEYFLSLVFHPWMNMATLAALLSFHSQLFSILFWVFFALWITNSIRKIRSGFKVSDFERPYL